jgi:release factor glutamine methyltransferase
LLLRDAALGSVTYDALLASDSAEDTSPIEGLSSLEVLSSTRGTTAAWLLRVRLHTTAALPTHTLLQRLHAAGHPVVGSLQLRAPGGCHLALTALLLPPSLQQLCGVAGSVRSEAPRKLEKTRRREELHAMRRSTEPCDAHALFMGLTFECPAHELRPRDSSACLVQQALRLLEGESEPRLLDLGCGVGALVLAAMCSLPAARGWGLDIDPAAILLARRNAASLLATASGLVTVEGSFQELHLLRERLPPSAHVILANPPFLRRAGERFTAERDDALYGGDADGLGAYRGIAASLKRCHPRLLAPGGALLLQLPASSGASAAVQQIFAARGFRTEGEHRDSRGIVRCLELRQQP